MAVMSLILELAQRQLYLSRMELKSPKCSMLWVNLLRIQTSAERSSKTSILWQVRNLSSVTLPNIKIIWKTSQVVSMKIILLWGRVCPFLQTVHRWALVKSTWLVTESLSWINGVGIRIFIKKSEGVLVKYRTNTTLLSNNNSKRLLKTLC